MAETVVNISERWDGQIVQGSVRNYTASSNRVYTIKQRRAANPFGFGLTDDDLSLRQKSILAALGISFLK
jgi:hypothetical protein